MCCSSGLLGSSNPICRKETGLNESWAISLWSVNITAFVVPNMQRRVVPTHPSYLLSIPSLVVPQRSFWISPRRFPLNSGSWAELAVHLWWAHSNLCWCCVHSQHTIIADVESPAHRAKHSTVYPSLNKEKRLCMFTWWYIVTFLYAS